ncbi:methyltransferase domain-containing protein [Aquabacter sp. P-9]|uniref:methyltransferase domain-containing protein n=1 Tax=Aquabacter sediminis TaxID=3029197 RepID=UPI00237E7BEE|nr:methyltransferase domain-containing protein [Aquabacter sp. P-9]MDE1566877.1 methyltransferase domain-containing protein [Aquabacter sp. P-9]
MLADGAMVADEDVRAGVLVCPDAACGARYPIVEGAPILVADLSGWLSANLHLLLQNELDHAGAADVIARAVGPDSAFGVVRQQASSYGYDHYGDLEPRLSAPQAQAGGVRSLLAQLLKDKLDIAGPALDLGCAAGRTAFDLADRTKDLVLGIDLNWPLLRIGRGVIDHGIARFPLRRIGLRYESCAFPAPLDPKGLVDFWVADALNLPFADATFGLVAALNVLDCVSSPRHALHEAERLLLPTGALVLATPFDWAAHATPQAEWHEEASLLALLAEAFAPNACPLRPASSPIDLTWNVRLHDRARMDYRCQGMVCTKVISNPA